MTACRFRIATFVGCTLCLIIFLGPLHSRAGELGESLARLTVTASPDSLVPVIAVLPSVVESRQLTTEAEQLVQTRAERYRFALAQLQARHAESQKRLLDHVRGQAAAAGYRRIKPHWLANVVEMELPISQVSALAARSDIESVTLLETLPSVDATIDSGAPVSSGRPLAAPYRPPHIAHVKADIAWGMGYTGAGRLICSFDTGVDGVHPALTDRWNGIDADTAASWFDPVFNTPYPQALPLYAKRDQSHGTHLMGLMVGGSDSVASGIAPGARWISAAVVDVPGASWLDAFEWAVNPDRDINTIADVPDVINHSWGFDGRDYGCRDVLFEVIDNVEALGIVNIFAAGNEGSLSPFIGTVRNPAVRANDSLDCFAVGNLDISTNPPTRQSSSSQGPSSCPGGGIKPNVMAPGYLVYSCVPGGGYLHRSGTSMSAPMVSGLVALLRQKRPDATPAEIKRAILNSTYRAPFGVIPNNQYGWGEIDCEAALRAIGNSPNQAQIRLYSVVFPAITPGSTVNGRIIVENVGNDASQEIAAAITGSNPSITVLDGTASVPSVPPLDTISALDPITLLISDTVTPGSLLTLPLRLNEDGNIIMTTLGVHVGVPDSRGFVTHNNGSIRFSLTDYGVLGVGNDPIDSWYPAGGEGFNFQSEGNSLWQASVLAGTGTGNVSSALHTLWYMPDQDFTVAPSGSIRLLAPGLVAPQQTIAEFTDESSPTPIGLRITQESFLYNAPNDEFVILRYIFGNRTGSTITGMRFGLMVDWASFTIAMLSGGYNQTDSILWTARNTGTTTDPVLDRFRGAARLEGALATALTERESAVMFLPERFTAHDGFTRREKDSLAVVGVRNVSTYASARDILFQILTCGPINLAPGQKDTVAFVLMAGSSYSSLVTALGEARLKYAQIVTDVPPPVPGELPDQFTLYQNYPNPFNPSTTISFDLPRESEYEIAIFNLLGQRVDDITGRSEAGRVSVNWQAGARGSGVYLYRVTAGSFIQSRKMVLLK